MTNPQLLKIYDAIIWIVGSDEPGKRVTVSAENGDIAKEKLRKEFGEEIIITLHNEEDASQPR